MSQLHGLAYSKSFQIRTDSLTRFTRICLLWGLCFDRAEPLAGIGFNIQKLRPHTDSDTGMWPSWLYEDDLEGAELRSAAFDRVYPDHDWSETPDGIEFDLCRLLGPLLVEGTVAIFAETAQSGNKDIGGWSLVITHDLQEHYVDLRDINKIAESLTTRPFEPL